MSFSKQLRSATNVNSQSGTGSYRGIVGDSKPNRFYRLRVAQRSSLNLALSSAKTNANLLLVSENGQVLNRTSSSQKAIAQTVEPGTYYVQVNRQRGKAHYRLNIGVNTASVAAANTLSGSSLAEQVVALVNGQRGQFGLKPLSLNAALSTAAQAHSQDMALNDFFGHTGANGSTIEQRILSTGYAPASYAENVAAGLATPEGVVQAWMNSPGHRKNILNPVLSEIGIGFFFLENDAGSTNYRYYWTQDFGQPQ